MLILKLIQKQLKISVLLHRNGKLHGRIDEHFDLARKLAINLHMNLFELLGDGTIDVVPLLYGGDAFGVDLENTVCSRRNNR